MLVKTKLHKVYNGNFDARPIKFKCTTLPVDFLGRMQFWWLFGFGKDYTMTGNKN
jgi:hypothetical protein